MLPSVAIFVVALLVTIGFNLAGYLILFLLLGVLIIIKRALPSMFHGLNKDALIDVLLAAIIVSLAVDIAQSMALTGHGHPATYDKDPVFSPAKKDTAMIKGGRPPKSPASRRDTETSVRPRYEAMQPVPPTTTGSMPNRTNPLKTSATQPSARGHINKNKDQSGRSGGEYRASSILPPAHKRRTTTLSSLAERSYHYKVPARTNTFTTLKRQPSQPEIVLIESSLDESGKTPKGCGKNAHKKNRGRKDKDDDADKALDKIEKTHKHHKVHKQHKAHKPDDRKHK